MLAAVALLAIVGSNNAAAIEEPPPSDDAADEFVAVAIAIGDLFINGTIAPPTVDFGERQNPFGLDAPAPVTSSSELAPKSGWGWRFPDPQPATNVGLYRDGETQIGNEFTFGGVDDEFAIDGEAAVLGVDGTLPDEFDGHFYEFAVLVTQAGFETATGNPNVPNDPNIGGTHRYGASITDGEFAQTFEQVVQGAWQPFQSPADLRFQTFEDGRFVMGFYLPPRFFEGTERIQLQFSSFPTDATDPSQAFFRTAELPLPLEPFVIEEVTDEMLAEAQLISNGELAPANPPVEPESPAQPEPSVVDEPPVDETPTEDPAPVEEPTEPEPEPEVVVADPQPAAVPDDAADANGGGLSPLIPLGGIAIGGVAIGGVIVNRRRKSSPLPVTDDEVHAPTTPTPSPLAPTDHLPPTVDVRSKQEFLDHQLRQMIEGSRADGNEADEKGWIRITPRAYQEALVGLPDDISLRDREQSDAAIHGVVLIVGDALIPEPDGHDDVFIHVERLDVHSTYRERLSREGLLTEPPEPATGVEATEPMMGSVSDAVKES